MKNKLNKITKLVDDLFFDYDRLSSSGQETLDKLGDLLGIEEEKFTEGDRIFTRLELVKVADVGQEITEKMIDTALRLRGKPKIDGSNQAFYTSLIKGE